MMKAWLERTAIIEKVLKSFLHNRESAMIFGTASTGNARAFQCSDDPLIRMRNTYIEPGEDKLNDIIKETKHGYIIKGNEERTGRCKWRIHVWR